MYARAQDRAKPPPIRDFLFSNRTAENAAASVLTVYNLVFL